MSIPRVVIDTNVMVSAAFGGKPREVVRRWLRGDMVICLSGPIIDEYVGTLERLGLNGSPEIRTLLEALAREHNTAFIANPPPLQVVDADPDDNKFVECAVALKAKFVVSGDKHLKELGRYMHIRIVSPSRFLTIQE